MMKWVVGIVLVAGCTGEIRRSAPAAGSDGAVPDRDGGRRDAGIVLMIDGSSMEDAGTTTVPGEDAGTGVDSGPSDPCAGVVCGTNEACVPATGVCDCVPGFADMGAGCVALPPGDPAGRTTAEVCGQWNGGHVENAATPWTPGATECDLGTLSPLAIEDTVRRISMFRWLAGLGAVTDDPARNTVAQHCATLMNANGRISHTPDTSWDCYTAQGAEGAGSSNLALGIRSPGQAIDLYMADPGTPSLGHRRWILNDPLGRVSIGFAGNAQCLGVFDSSGSTSRMWTAYPNPGPAPVETASDLWSFHSRSLSLGGTDVTVERMSDGAALAVRVTHPASGFGPDTVAFEPMGWTPAAGTSYRVTITGVSGGPIVYVVQLVSC